MFVLFFSHDTAPTEIYTLSLHDALPIFGEVFAFDRRSLDLADPSAITSRMRELRPDVVINAAAYTAVDGAESERDLAMKVRSEEHTSELQSQSNLVCRLLLEKKKKKK